MLDRTILSSSLILCTFICGIAAGQDQGSAQQQPFSLGEFARQQQLKKQLNSGANNDIHRGTQTAQAAIVDDTDLNYYEGEVRGLLSQRNFEQLDKMASEDRVSKARLRGGLWRLYAFYEALRSPLRGETAADWQAHFEIFKSWIAARPSSITARVALANAYLEYAWKARGGGFADTVTDQGWKGLEAGTEQAKSTLIEAAKLRDKCPHWYSVMQGIALAEGWEKSKALALFDEATAFEPSYYTYYREYANYLLPKWYGDEGEAEDFAEEVYQRVGGQQGEFLYFEIATVINCQCGHDEIHMAHMSWPRIQKGYAVMQQLYGITRLKINRFAYLSYLAGDKLAAQQTFAQISDAWDAGVWKTLDRFLAVKSWAFAQ